MTGRKKHFLNSFSENYFQCNTKTVYHVNGTMVCVNRCEIQQTKANSSFLCQRGITVLSGIILFLLLIKCICLLRVQKALVPCMMMLRLCCSSVNRTWVRSSHHKYVFSGRISVQQSGSNLISMFCSISMGQLRVFSPANELAGSTPHIESSCEVTTCTPQIQGREWLPVLTPPERRHI